jgi:nucleoside-diphosphate-sugar epimerase
MAGKMNHMLFLGFGLSAKTLAPYLKNQNWRITGTSRSESGAESIRALGFDGVVFDQLQGIPESVTHIISSVPPGASGDPVLHRFGGDLGAMASQFAWVAYLSTTGVYGDHAGAWTDENTPLTPNTERGERRLQAEQAWLNLYRGRSMPLHIFRLAGIYGPGRNQLLSVLDGTAKRVIKPGQVFSRIHVDDIAGILLASMAKPNPGNAYNVADDEPCPPQDVVAHAARLLSKPVPPDVPFEAAELSPMARSFYADSKRVCNLKVKEELAYRFRFPNYRDGLAALLPTVDQ